MEHETESPMAVVEGVASALSRIASLCTIMMYIDDRDGTVQPEDVGQVMAHLRCCLNEQIEALDGIWWTQ